MLIRVIEIIIRIRDLIQETLIYFRDTGSLELDLAMGGSSAEDEGGIPKILLDGDAAHRLSQRRETVLLPEIVLFFPVVVYHKCLTF